MELRTIPKLANEKLLIIKNGGGKNSLKRTIAFFGAVILSGGFVLMAYKGKLGSETFLTYPLGLIILYVPQLAINLLKIWKGQSIDGGQGQ